MKGAPERILELCTHYLKEDRSAILTAKEIERIHKTVVQMSSKGLRGMCYYISAFFKCVNIDSSSSPRLIF